MGGDGEAPRNEDRTSPSIEAEVTRIEMKPLSDRAYETLYFSLLDLQAKTDAAASTEQISPQLGARCDDKNFVGWLRRFGKQRLKNATAHQALARRMLAFSTMNCGQVSILSREVGKQLLAKVKELPTRSTISEHIVSTNKNASKKSNNSYRDEDERLANLYFQQGDASYSNNDLAGALNAYEKAISITPNDHVRLSNKGYLLEKLGKYEDAIIAYDAALQIQPDYHVALSNKGVSLALLGRREDAIAAYDAALKIKPDHADALSSKGVSLEALGKYEAAIVAYDSALKADPNHLTAQINKGNVLSSIRDYEGAFSAYNDALKIEPTSPEALFAKGGALYNLGRYEEAIGVLDKALAIKPDDSIGMLNKGLSLCQMGQYESAIAGYDSVLSGKIDMHEAWISRGSAVDETVNTALTMHSPLTLQHPELRKRGYEGAQASYATGLKYVQKSTDPEGYGLLHHQMGRCHYFHGRFLPNADFYLIKAAKSYREALTTLTAIDFPELHLEVLEDAIRTHLGLRNVDIVKTYRDQGLIVFRQLLNDNPTLARRQQLEHKFSSFSQVQVDTLIKEGNLHSALETAERYKNRTLSWILDIWQEQTVSPSWTDIQQLLSDTTVYWHLSPDTLTTFLLTAGVNKPQIISSTSAEILKTWAKDWQQVYQTYRKKGKSAEVEIADRDRPNHPWRLSLEANLRKLGEILEIDKIESHLSHHTHLLLVPHRQLHQLPLHALFTKPLITTYLPSLQTGLTLKQKQTNQLLTTSLPALLPETPENDTLEALVFAEVETTFITHLCHQQGNSPSILNSDKASNASLTANLTQPHRLFHFTGHAAHDYRHPKNSALALTGTDTLTANEIANLSLDTYDLVTLAACETAVAGQVNLDTDYVGLASAFLTAGANQVISTLWTVDSESNAWLMVHFYQQYLTGIPAPIALHKSQQWLKNVTHSALADWLETLNTKAFQQSCQHQEARILTITIGKHREKSSRLGAEHKPFANPYYWAAFILTGYCHEEGD